MVTVDVEKYGNSDVSTPPSKDKAAKVVSTEIYSNGLAVGEIAEKYDVSTRAVTWLMKERGIGFAPRDQGEPPEYVKVELKALSAG